MGNNKREKNAMISNSGSSGDEKIAVQIKDDFDSPIPHPEIIAGYEKICPGAADRILRMAEKQSDHRILQEHKFMRILNIGQILGQIFCFLITGAALWGSMNLLFEGKRLDGFVALVAAGVPIMSGMVLRKAESSKKK